MTGFDIIVLLIVGVAAVSGLMRGFVQEVLSLAAWSAAVVAIRLFHNEFTTWLERMTDSPTGAAVLAFVLLLIVPYAIIQMMALQAGKRSRRSVLAPFDRVLGFAFGALKGVIIVVILFSLLVLGYDTIWGVEGRPEWLREARSYAFINASSQEMVKLIEERRELLLGEDAEAQTEESAG